jgi:hypothetical protein
MPSALAPGFLYSSNGRDVITPGPQATAYRRTEDDDRLRPAPRNHLGDWIDLISSRDSRRLISESRAQGTRGDVVALLEQKADYIAASDFRPTFLGSDTTYSAAAQPILESAFQIANLRGYLWDWRTTWRLCIPTLATDGRVYVLLTRWPDTGWPALQILEAHRIGQRSDAQLVGQDDAVTLITEENGATKKIRGAYRGLRIKNGIIYNAAGTEVAYRVLGADPEGAEDQDISARDLFPIARPRSFSEGTTPPELAAALFDFIGLELANSAQLDQQIEDARLTLIEQNATGKYDAGAGFGGGASPGYTGPRGPDASAPGTPTTDSKRGRTRYVKTGYAVTPFESARPSDQWMNFDSRRYARGASTLRWRAEMLDPAGLRGASNRALEDQINTLIRDGFLTVAKGAARAANYISAVLSGPALGALPLHPESMKWGIAVPPWFQIDRASAKYDLDDVAAGRTSMRTLHARDGKTSMEIYLERAHDYKEAEEVAAKQKVPLEFILGDWGATVQRTGANQSAEDPKKKEATPAE